MVCQDQETCDWFARSVPALTAWEGSRFKVVGTDSLPTFKRDTAWFLGPLEDMETLFRHPRRLNQGSGRSISARRNPHGVQLVLSTDQTLVAALEMMKWKAFSRLGQATFSLLGAKPEGKK
jgi:hypothetical protein